jgi:hypothetical protein
VYLATFAHCNLCATVQLYHCATFAHCNLCTTVPLYRCVFSGSFARLYRCVFTLVRYALSLFAICCQCVTNRLLFPAFCIVAGSRVAMPCALLAIAIGASSPWPLEALGALPSGARRRPGRSRRSGPCPPVRVVALAARGARGPALRCASSPWPLEALGALPNELSHTYVVSPGIPGRHGHRGHQIPETSPCACARAHGNIGGTAVRAVRAVRNLFFSVPAAFLKALRLLAAPGGRRQGQGAAGGADRGCGGRWGAPLRHGEASADRGAGRGRGAARGGQGPPVTLSALFRSVAARLAHRGQGGQVDRALSTLYPTAVCVHARPPPSHTLTCHRAPALLYTLSTLSW